ncbi:hypothetical protein GIB67_024170 [Kingdonia uniflora]|uniref:Uncharacterized protein n=1 Tax=Kingdonia uniflora TaxID=39325 RepID=A0A7J7LZF4_9MAGN|nr:hypothetical protein GIB67_024170 [Kingdonia uniflora]
MEMVKTRSQSSWEAASRRIKQLYDKLVMGYFGSVNLNGPPLPPREASYEGMCKAETALWRENFHLHCQMQTIILHPMARRATLVARARNWLGRKAPVLSVQLTMEDSVDENWSKVIVEEYPERFLEYDILKLPMAFIMTSHLLLRASNLFERASKMKESFDFVILKLDELESYLQSYDDALTQIDASQQNISTSVAYSMVSGTIILNPLVVQTKGRAKINHKKGARWKGGMEEAIMKKKRTCRSCGVLSNHDKRTCSLLKTMIAESRDNNNGESIQPLHSNFDKHNI